MVTKRKQILKGKNKATPKTLEIILNAISSGLSQRDAAALAGISEDTLSLWKRNSDFSEQIRGKEIEFKQSLIKNIKKAGEKDWRADAWLLEKLHKDEFSNKIEVDLDKNQKLEELGNTIRAILTPKEKPDGV